MRQDPGGTSGALLTQYHQSCFQVPYFTFVQKYSPAYNREKKLKTITLEKWSSNFTEPQSYLEGLLKQKLQDPLLEESL